ncbi:porin, partial [Burkholderia cenocepacia]|uniref:porin n=1 Tax=Burkholderia cenocepacia TaxID=95486 RepID=UPI002861BAAC
MKSCAHRSLRAAVLTGSAAVAGLAAGAAHAQSSVSMYGIMDAGIEFTNHAAPQGGNSVKLKSG